MFYFSGTIIGTSVSLKLTFMFNFPSKRSSNAFFGPKIGEIMPIRVIRILLQCDNSGYIDVGDRSWRQFLLKMLLTDLRCWRVIFYILKVTNIWKKTADKIILNIVNLSPS